eukprot:10304226-Karenia_brevis.AAC.1
MASIHFHSFSRPELGSLLGRVNYARASLGSGQGLKHTPLGPITVGVPLQRRIHRSRRLWTG